MAVSTQLIEMMCIAGLGLIFEAQLTHMTDKFVGFAFVDNTNIVSGYLKSMDITMENVYAYMNEAIDCWEIY